LEAQGVRGENGLKLIIHDGARDFVLPCRRSGLTPNSSAVSSTSSVTSPRPFTGQTALLPNSGSGVARRP
jgi:hypothetical protein